MKIVINNGKEYGLSKAAYEYLGLDWEKLVVWPCERIEPGLSKKINLRGMWFYFSRTNKKLIDVVEKLGKDACAPGCSLQVLDFEPFDSYRITIGEDGYESLILERKIRRNFKQIILKLIGKG